MQASIGKICIVFGLLSALPMATGCEKDQKARKGGGQQPGVTIESQLEKNPQNPSTGVTGATGATGPSGAQDSVTGTADCYKADATICAIEAEILRLTNEERKSPNGLFRRSMQPLKTAPKLSWVARQWSIEQASDGSIGHSGFPNERMRAFRQEFPSVQVDISAENVAMTGYGESVAREFFEMWRDSPGHYANMMGDYAAMGIGVFHGQDGWYATEIFGDE